MGQEAVLGLHFRMAGIAELGYLVASDLLAWPLVELVAVEAADVVECMGGGVPVGDGWDGCRGMALKADKGLGLGGKMHDVQKLGGIALCLGLANSFELFVDRFDGQAAGSVT